MDHMIEVSAIALIGAAFTIVVPFLVLISVMSHLGQSAAGPDRRPTRPDRQ